MPRYVYIPGFTCPAIILAAGYEYAICHMPVGLLQQVS